MLRAVRHHTDCPWVLLFIARWLKASVQMEDGGIVWRTAGTPQGGVISPLLANLFLHYAFDMWMARKFPHIPFERYADDVICHCRSEAEARALWQALASRLAGCKLTLHPEKTKIVYCKDAKRKSGYPVIRSISLGSSSGPARRCGTRDGRVFTHSFPPAGQSGRADAHRPGNPQLGASSTQRQVPGIPGRDVQFENSRLDQLLQPLLQTRMRPTLAGSTPMSSGGPAANISGWRAGPGERRIGSSDRRSKPLLFAHWLLCYGNGRTSGAV